MNAVLAITDPGDEIDPAGAVLLQSRDGDRDGRRAAGARCRRRPDLSARSGRDRARHHAANARGRDGLAEQPDRRGLPGGRAARGERALPRRAASSTFTTRPTSTSPTASAAPFLAGVDRRRRGAHDLALLAVEGVRDGELAHRLHGDSRRALVDAVNKIQDTMLICAPAVSQQAAHRGRAVGAGYARAASRRPRPHASAAFSTRCATRPCRATTPASDGRVLLFRQGALRRWMR